MDEIFFESLLNKSQETEANCLMESSKKMYQSSLRVYMSTMTQLFPLITPLPITEDLMRVFIEYEKTCLHRTCNTLLNHIASFAHYFSDNNMCDITKSPTFKKYRKGLGKMLRQHAVPNRKLGLTPDVLIQMTSNMKMEDYNDAIFIMTISTMYYGFMRASEMTQLKIENVYQEENSIVLHIDFSKTDPTGYGADIEIMKRDDPFNPCIIYEQLLKNFQEKMGIFLWPYSMSMLRNRLKHELIAIGIENVEKYSLHSCRRGGAAAASLAGVQDSVIKAHGRWLSEAYQIYIQVNARKAGLEITSLI